MNKKLAKNCLEQPFVLPIKMGKQIELPLMQTEFSSYL